MKVGLNWSKAPRSKRPAVRKIALVVMALFSLILVSCNKKSAGAIPDGVQRVETVHKLTDSVKAEVLEFLWLGCPSCKDFHSSWVELKKEFGTQANFRAYPAAFPKWEFDTRVYLVMRELGIANDGLIANYYQARQGADAEQLGSGDVQQVAQWLQQRYDVDAQSVVAMWESSLISSRMAEAAELVEKYAITGVPTVLVSVPGDGTYIVKGGQAAAKKQAVKTLLEKAL